MFQRSFNSKLRKLPLELIVYDPMINVLHVLHFSEGGSNEFQQMYMSVSEDFL